MNRDAETESKLAILLSILEPLLINDQNLEKALDMPIIQILTGLLELPPHFKNVDRKHDIEQPKLPIYLKYTLRCVTSCCRHPSGVEFTRKNHRRTFRAAWSRVVPRSGGLPDEQVSPSLTRSDSKEAKPSSNSSGGRRQPVIDRDDVGESWQPRMR